jgi:hypothetical protein
MEVKTRVLFRGGESNYATSFFRGKRSVVHDGRDAFRNGFDERCSKPFHERGAGGIFGTARRSDDSIADFRRHDICPLKLSAAFGILDFHATQGTSMPRAIGLSVPLSSTQTRFPSGILASNFTNSVLACSDFPE